MWRCVVDDIDDTQDTGTTSRKRPSPLLFLAGLAALLVSGWALVGPFSLEPLANVEFRWLFVLVAVVVGAVLVFAPNRKR
ncbi:MULTISPECIES: hypothetical protein [Rhodococcus]|jgi:hypothetical protein|uniref:Uncharacterized protein n=1 Tax=Rhodococcus oxybenzonivorans TaxID=1990687 RepID=A0AAE4UUP2_9NOCA|nr:MULTISPECIES: hypothetical protein [Rhodococcus]MDV7245464.1 hypothetical protein [Rhodococcus oxybenzonivorans]MDV7263265.1 hypothetical protein [Rhodococcus oxybenzonivorans]MDV7276544.1 hypothetical protein [Rhodococcus oxybenzonivorans]MDV7336529.1 hypothetical protein [Rhodococcus oxybenzonivorans]MDV7346860.1 hypothetical protein [Rhodococcus oxybenzonivorans]